MPGSISISIARRGFGGNMQDVELYEVYSSRSIIRPLDSFDISVNHTYNSDDKFTVR